MCYVGYTTYVYAYKHIGYQIQMYTIIVSKEREAILRNMEYIQIFIFKKVIFTSLLYFNVHTNAISSRYKLIILYFVCKSAFVKTTPLSQ